METITSENLSVAMKNYADQQENVALRYQKLSISARRLENNLIEAWVSEGATGTITRSKRQLASELELSGDSIRKGCIALMGSQRWEIVAGIGRTETTYAPLFLDALNMNGGK